MSSANSDFKKFAVFVNSKQSLVESTTKSECIIPFNGNMIDHDPLKVVRFSITDFLFSNVFYNVYPGVQTLKYIDVFAPGRNISTYTYSITQVVVPIGNYNYDSLTAYLNTTLGNAVNTSFSTGSAEVFYGFGSTYNGLTTNDIAASGEDQTTGKVFANSPSLGDLYQPFKKDSSVTATGNSGIYCGKYLISDNDTYGLMHQLGFSFSTVVAPAIPNTPFTGWGFPIYSRQVASATQYSFDNVNFGTSSADLTVKTVVPICISNLSGLDDLYIHCDQLRTHYLSGILKYPLAPSDVVAVIPINVPFGDKMLFVPNFPLESFLVNTNITQLTFRMTNSNNVPLDFNGTDWSMTIYCEQMADESRIELENYPDSGNFTTPASMPYQTQAGAHMEHRLKSSRRN
jgi:hypothetical protein